MSVLFNDLTFTIANGQSVSDAKGTGSGVPVAVLAPAAWTAADLAFEISEDGTSWKELYDGASPVKVPVTADKWITMPSSAFALGHALRVKSVTNADPLSTAAVNQEAERVIKMRCRKTATE